VDKEPKLGGPIMVLKVEHRKKFTARFCVAGMACFKLCPSLSVYVLDIVITGVNSAKDSIQSSIVVIINALNYVILWTERSRWWSSSQCVC
jgi:hypothetical protein